MKISTSKIVFFDWDDTLHPTSTQDQYTPEEWFTLRKIVEGLFRQAVNTCDGVYIVTNSDRGWVQLSILKHYPDFDEGLLQKIRIYSAKSRWEHIYPNQPTQWKYRTFHDCLQMHLYDTSHCNVLSIGDSSSEREAINELQKTFQQSCVFKSLKLPERLPKIVFSRILILLTKCWDFLVDHDEPLDFQLNYDMEALLRDEQLMTPVERKSFEDLDTIEPEIVDIPL